MLGGPHKGSNLLSTDMSHTFPAFGESAIKPLTLRSANSSCRRKLRKKMMAALGGTSQMSCSELPNAGQTWIGN